MSEYTVNVKYGYQSIKNWNEMLTHEKVACRYCVCVHDLDGTVSKMKIGTSGYIFTTSSGNILDYFK